MNSDAASKLDDPNLIAAAQAGDAAAVEALIESVRDRIYCLTLRMVTQRSDAEDATQEILVKILTRLSTFKGEAKFSTWAHRIAVNHLLDRKKSAVENLELTFEMYGDDLQQGLSAAKTPGPEAGLLAAEVRLGCTQAMLTCIDREHRIAYVLGEVFEVSSSDGAYICDVSAATYRKRLSRARDRVRTFVGQNCGLVNPDEAACRCSRRIDTAVSLGRINPVEPEFASHPAEDSVEQMEKLFDAAALMPSHPKYTTPKEIADTISTLVYLGDFDLLS
jgi:RNA polymerase sigma factor (sigma-70 family)